MRTGTGTGAASLARLCRVGGLHGPSVPFRCGSDGLFHPLQPNLSAAGGGGGGGGVQAVQKGWLFAADRRDRVLDAAAKENSRSLVQLLHRCG